MDSAAGQKVKVEIFGKYYMLTGDDDNDRIREIAAFVDGKMRELADQIKVFDNADVAILTALNIAGEVFQLRRQLSLMADSVETMSQDLIHLIEHRVTELNDDSGDALGDADDRLGVDLLDGIEIADDL